MTTASAVRHHAGGATVSTRSSSHMPAQGSGSGAADDAARASADAQQLEGGAAAGAAAGISRISTDSEDVEAVGDDIVEYESRVNVLTSSTDVCGRFGAALSGRICRAKMPVNSLPVRKGY